MTLSSHRLHSIAALTLIATTLAAVTGCHNVTPAVKSSANNAVAVYSIPVDVMKDYISCLLYTSPSPRDRQKSRMPSSA